MHTTRPRVDIEDVQALVKGFGRSWVWSRFYMLRMEGDGGREARAELAQALNALPKMTSYAELTGVKPPSAVNLAISYRGLQKLGVPAKILATFPDEFRQNMRSRATLNGDVGASDPAQWDSCWTDGVDLLIAAYAMSDDDLANADSKLRGAFESAACLSLLDTQDAHRFLKTADRDFHIEDKSSQASDGAVMEHFGFRDGVSQPVFAGLDEKHVVGGGKYSTEANWQPLATGELLLGYPDEAGELASHPRPVEIGRNGTFLVYRKLRQNVDLFRDHLLEASARAGVMNADAMAERMIGRERDGTPLLAEADGLNGYTYASDALGNQCPLGAHARRANPRNTMGEDTVLVNRHRVLRRAITYGDPVPHGQRERDVNGDAGQGLVFIALNADIERQFEFVQQQWLNFGNDLGQGNDRDPVVGANLNRGQFVIPGEGERHTAILNSLPDFVTTQGGEYFFLPGINGWKLILANRYSVSF